MTLVLCVLLLLLWEPQTSAGQFSSSGSEKVSAAPRLSCRNEKDEEVQWYILYKEPGDKGYIYISTNVKKELNEKIGDSKGALANTLKPLFDKNMPQSFGFLCYNDQPPPEGKSESSCCGHSKGVVLGDSKTQTALWITHSTPQFPYKGQNQGFSAQNFWPTTGNAKGQSFMCVTLKFDELDKIGTHLKHIRAYTFAKRNEGIFPPVFIDVINKKWRDPSVQTLNFDGLELKLVAKGIAENAKDGDLYVQLSREFNSVMEAKTWPCQRNTDMSYCTEQKIPKVMNVEDVKTDLGEWKWGSDHSKWAVTTDNNIHWTCIADMNRAESQYLRPGGAMCIKDEKVSGWFKGFVKKDLPCGEPPSKRRKGCDNKRDMEQLSDDVQNMNLYNKHQDL